MLPRRGGACRDLSHHFDIVRYSSFLKILDLKKTPGYIVMYLTFPSPSPFSQFAPTETAISSYVKLACASRRTSS